MKPSHHTCFPVHLVSVTIPLPLLVFLGPSVRHGNVVPVIFAVILSIVLDLASEEKVFSLSPSPF